MKHYYNQYGDLVHLIYNVFQVERLPQYENAREDLCDPKSALQISVINVWGDEKIVKPHSHMNVERHTNESVEAWIVVRGSATVKLFDEQTTFMATCFLYAGDILITFKGGHSLNSSDLLMIECKNGPFVDTKQWIE